MPSANDFSINEHNNVDDDNRINEKSWGVVNKSHRMSGISMNALLKSQTFVGLD